MTRNILEQLARPQYGYQMPFAATVRQAAGVQTMAVGLIIHADQTERTLQADEADLVAIGREFLHNPNWALDVAEKMGIAPSYAQVPSSYGYWLEKRANAGFGGRPTTWQAGIEPDSANDPNTTSG